MSTSNIDRNERDVANGVAGRMLLSSFIASVPLIFIYLLDAYEPDSDFLIYLSFIYGSSHGVFSSENIVLSKVMSLYLKTAPLILIFIIACEAKRMKLKKNESMSFFSKIIVLMGFGIFYSLYLYVFLFSDTDLAQSSKLLKLASLNDTTLLIFFMLVYAGVCVLGFMYAWVIIGLLKKFKGR